MGYAESGHQDETHGDRISAASRLDHVHPAVHLVLVDWLTSSIAKINGRSTLNSSKFPYWKLIGIWAVFLLLHYSYKLFPNALFQLIGAVAETYYLHMKMMFFAYLFVSAAEFFVKRNTIANVQQFLTGRALVAVAFPWLTVTIFFLPEAFTGEMLPFVWEIIWANVVLVLGAYLALRLDQALDQVEFRPALRWMIWLVFLSALLSYTLFTFNTPDHFFQPPEEYQR